MSHCSTTVVQQFCKLKVAGSIPASGTTIIGGLGLHGVDACFANKISDEFDSRSLHQTIR